MNKKKFKQWGGRGMISTVTAIIIAIISWIFFTNQGISTTLKAGDNSLQVANSHGFTINYSDKEDPNYLNARSKSLLGKEPLELTFLFFELQNQNRYRDACSLLVKRKYTNGCNSVDGNNVADFSNQKKKFTNGYENVTVLPLNQGKYNQSMCVKYSYTLKTDSNPAQIREYYTYDREKREDGERELASRVCEEITKIGKGQIGCLKETQNKRCYNLLK